MFDIACHGFAGGVGIDNSARGRPLRSENAIVILFHKTGDRGHSAMRRVKLDKIDRKLDQALKK